MEQHDEKKRALDARELAKFVKSYSDSRQWTMEPVFPTEEEMAMILQAAGDHKPSSMHTSEILFALSLWHSYIPNRFKIEQIFDKYDTDRSKKLEFDQLVRYLTDLNREHPPKVVSAILPIPRIATERRRGAQESEVRALMHEVNAEDGVSMVQLTLATSLW